VTTRRAAAVETALLEKGMERDENHHHMFRKTLEGVTHLVTRTSHAGYDIDDNLGRRMANQLSSVTRILESHRLPVVRGRLGRSHP
jgi:hypothetical protein